MHRRGRRHRQIPRWHARARRRVERGGDSSSRASPRACGVSPAPCATRREGGIDRRAGAGDPRRRTPRRGWQQARSPARGRRAADRSVRRSVRRRRSAEKIRGRPSRGRRRAGRLERRARSVRPGKASPGCLQPGKPPDSPLAIRSGSRLVARIFQSCRAGQQSLRADRDAFDDVIAGIDDEEHPTALKKLTQELERVGAVGLQPERGGDRLCRPTDVGERRQIDEPDAVTERRDRLLRHRQRDGRLAHSASTNDRDEPRLLEIPSNRGDRVGAPKDARLRNRQIVTGRR